MKDEKFIALNYSEMEVKGNNIEIWAEGIRDEYHTMEELYDHRRALTILLTKVIMKNYYKGLTCMRSKLHHDGTMFEGYFVVVIYRPFKPGQQVSYHYKLEHWDEFEHCITQDKISIEYDGHTSLDVIKRLENFEVEEAYERGQDEV